MSDEERMVTVTGVKARVEMLSKYVMLVGEDGQGVRARWVLTPSEAVSLAGRLEEVAGKVPSSVEGETCGRET